MMAVKFPLEMKNGIMARNISEVKENFDIEKIVSYFLEGKLLTWLEARYYEDEAEAITTLVKEDPELAKKLCEIFGVEYASEDAVDTEEIARRNAKIAKLKQYTDDEKIIADVDFVAFDQEELADIYDTGALKIYLCAGEFNIPKSKQNLEYIELGNAVVMGKKKNVVPDEMEFEVRTRYLWDSRVEASYTNKAGEVYNVTVDGIYVKNITKNTENLITEDRENVKRYIAYSNKIVYSVETGTSYSKIYMRDYAGQKYIISEKLIKKLEFVYIDNEKVIWKDYDGKYYVKYYSETEERQIYNPLSHGNSLLFNICVWNNIFFYTERNHNLYSVNMVDATEKFIQKETYNIGVFNEILYIVSCGNTNYQNFYQMSLPESELEYLGSTHQMYGGTVIKFELYNELLVWINTGSKFFKLYVLDLQSKKHLELDTWKGNCFGDKVELKLDDEWIYYNNNEHHLEEHISRKIKYDGTEKTDFLLEFSGNPLGQLAEGCSAVFVNSMTKL